ncbi:hypothetical protein DIPPA_15809 [Diplonema papillatum]|nr:hypothetical protein DIPPA_15809 [Diplonema papillatum]
MPGQVLAAGVAQKMRWCNSVRTKNCGFCGNANCKFLHIDSFVRMPERLRRVSGVKGIMDKHARAAKKSYTVELKRAIEEADGGLTYDKICSLFELAGFTVGESSRNGGAEQVVKNIIKLSIQAMHHDIDGAPDQIFRALASLEDVLDEYDGRRTPPSPDGSSQSQHASVSTQCTPPTTPQAPKIEPAPLPEGWDGSAGGRQHVVIRPACAPLVPLDDVYLLQAARKPRQPRPSAAARDFAQPSPDGSPVPASPFLVTPISTDGDLGVPARTPLAPTAAYLTSAGGGMSPRPRSLGAADAAPEGLCWSEDIPEATGTGIGRPLETRQKHRGAPLADAGGVFDVGSGSDVGSVLAAEPLETKRRHLLDRCVPSATVVVNEKSVETVLAAEPLETKRRHLLDRCVPSATVVVNEESVETVLAAEPLKPMRRHLLDRCVPLTPSNLADDIESVSAAEPLEKCVALTLAAVAAGEESAPAAGTAARRGSNPVAWSSEPHHGAAAGWGALSEPCSPASAFDGRRASGLGRGAADLRPPSPASSDLPGACSCEARMHRRHSSPVEHCMYDSDIDDATSCHASPSDLQADASSGSMSLHDDDEPLLCDSYYAAAHKPLVTGLGYDSPYANLCPSLYTSVDASSIFHLPTSQSLDGLEVFLMAAQ